MAEDSVVCFRRPEEIEDPLTELLRSGAQRLIQQAVEAELLSPYGDKTDRQGRGQD